MALAGVALLASCTQPDKVPKPDENTQTTTRWVENPAVDLMSPEGTFIRAAVESLGAAWGMHGHTGQDAIKEGGYPGFDRAFNNAAKVDDFGSAEPDLNPRVGTGYNTVISVTAQGGRSTAVVCADSRQMAARRDDGRYAMNYLANAVAGLTITFGPDPKITGDQQHSPPANQRGIAKRPSDNVFGTWVLFDYRVSYTPDPKCRTFAPDAPKDTDSDLRADAPPTLPPEPGWPEGGSA
ncbi:Uncharacterised protein [Mycobacteroides abscessus subsp. bolletii]|uniref:hypothetical protein n=1 Tax=Mycobacteroides abscessus TaxID=36809 RepID=UPI0009CD46BE|nr:hypothetical protein [Mycobacteroides abscessus]SKR94603.1 Uncharacterised protein [Mycobacteroides abscessus subsp. bolletii]SKS02809.1 Uncharacterised protein [Mycobacteroides abscessus subsp. bolletii]